MLGFGRSANQCNLKALDVLNVAFGEMEMSAAAPRAPLSVYMLADHLDAALAAGEDLVALGARWRTHAEAASEDLSYLATEREIAESVKSSELMLVARTLKAREHARALAQIDRRFEPIANLFVSGTAILLDAVEESEDATGDDFDTGDGLLAYVRSRGLIAPDAVMVMNASQLTIDDSFLVAKRLALGPLLDMVAAFLDALELHYELFVAEDTRADARDDLRDGAKAAPARTEFGRRERAPVN